MLSSLRIAWIYCKKYAWIGFAVLAAVLGYFLLRRNLGDVSQIVGDVSKQHDEEIRRIREADEQRRQALEANQKKMEEALKLLDEKHRLDIEQLDAEQRKEADRLVAEHGDDPRALAEALAQAFGLKVVDAP